MPGVPSTLVGRTEGSTHVALLVDRPPTAGTWWHTVRGVGADGWVGRPSAEASVVVVAPSAPSTGPVASPSAASAGPSVTWPGGASPVLLGLASLAVVGLLLIALVARRRRRRG